jgi:hypothetical protein
MGTWKLNTAKSKLPRGTARNDTVQYEYGFMRRHVTIDGKDAHGKPTHNEWSGNFDGGAYPVTGDPRADNRIYKLVDEHTMDFWQKKDGKVTTAGRIVVAADGKTRTVTARTFNRRGRIVKMVAVYDRAD